MTLIFVDVEADFGVACPNLPQGGMTQFGAVDFALRQWFHGRPYEWASAAYPAWNECQIKERGQWYQVLRVFEEWLHQFKPPHVFMSDNPAYDWQWINYHFHHELGRNPFGHSARRIGDFYAGLCGDFRKSSQWKKLRVTKHTHMPVDDAMGNCEAFERMLKGER